MAKPIVDQVVHLGKTYPLTVRRVRGGFTWQLGHEDGSPMKSGHRRVSDVETARQVALSYLERTWPFGRENPFGTGNGSA